MVQGVFVEEEKSPGPRDKPDHEVVKSILHWQGPEQYPGSGLPIEGVLVYFTHLECQKHIGDDVGDVK
jgi:hypothetical protein